jgi:DNA-binding XRE family transcriptional regulator
MIIYNNQEYKNFKELREKCHLVTERYIRIVCHCRSSFTEKICKENCIEKYTVNALGKECEVFSDKVIDLINKIKPQENDIIPENYITRKELAKYLNVSLGTLSNIEFWCWDFRNYKKAFTVKGSLKICYEFTPETKDFYDRKIYKWRNPDRKHGTCWQR